jgi:hypothetical protein
MFSTRFHASLTAASPAVHFCPRRLAKGGRLGKIVLGFVCAAAIAQAADDPRDSARECVARADSPAAILGCERQAQADLRERIAAYDAALRAQLDGEALQRYVAAQAAWASWAEAETALIAVTLARRADAVAMLLAEGARSQLLERRVAELAGYLAAPAVGGGR